jgi:hypothetical protein
MRGRVSAAAQRAIAKAKRDQGGAGIERGRLAEERALAAVLDHRERWPAWLTGVRAATALEDRHGVDLVAETADAGEVGIQIKVGSAWTIAKHPERYPEVPLLAVGSDSGRPLYQRALGRIGEGRRRELARRETEGATR